MLIVFRLPGWASHLRQYVMRWSRWSEHLEDARSTSVWPMDRMSRHQATPEASLPGCSSTLSHHSRRFPLFRLKNRRTLTLFTSLSKQEGCEKWVILHILREHKQDCRFDFDSRAGTEMVPDPGFRSCTIAFQHHLQGSRCVTSRCTRRLSTSWGFQNGDVRPSETRAAAPAPGT